MSTSQRPRKRARRESPERTLLPPPVSKLSKELLWEIFMINADMEFQDPRARAYDSPQDNMRSVSQVCRLWRAVASSDLLWAKVVDFDAMTQQRNIWRHAVLDRTGTRQIDVRGTVTAYSLEFFLTRILAQSWPRIRTLLVHVNMGTDGMILLAPSWASLFRPAPALRYFSLVFDTIPLPLLIWSQMYRSRQFFGNFAPSLRMCNIYHFVNPALHQASWLMSLTVLELAATTPEAGGVTHALLVLAILSRTPQLERLLLGGYVSDSPLAQLSNAPHVSLPCLKYVFMRGSPRSGPALLERLVNVPENCSMRLMYWHQSAALVNGIPALTSTSEDVLGAPVLARYCSNYLRTHTVTTFKLGLTVRLGMLRFNLVDLSHGFRAVDEILFRLPVSPWWLGISDNNDLMHAFMDSFLQQDAFLSTRFATDKKCYLDFSLYNWDSLDNDTVVRDFLYMILAGVESLSASIITLHSLHYLWCKFGKDPVPRLKNFTLQRIYGDDPRRMDPEDLKKKRRFVKWRKRLNAPVEYWGRVIWTD